MHVACPNCGTSYELAPEVLARPRLQLRCRRCHEVWHPLASEGDDADEAGPDVAAEAVAPQVPKEPEPTEPPTPAPASASATPEPEPTPTATAAPPDAPARTSRGLTLGLSAVALILVLVGTASLFYAFRDQLPGLGPPLPELTQGEVFWATDVAEPLLLVGVQLTNPARRPVRVEGIRVRFLSNQGAWIAERVVAVPVAVLGPGETVPVELALEGLPEGTASLDLSALVDRPV